MTNELLTPGQVRDKCFVNLETVYRWLRSGSLHGVKLGKRKLWRISSDALDEFLRKGESETDDSKQQTD